MGAPGTLMVVMLDDSWMPGALAALKRMGVRVLHEADPVKAATRVEEAAPDGMLVHARARRLALQRLYASLVSRGLDTRTVVVAPDSLTGSGLEAAPPERALKVPSRLSGDDAVQWVMQALGWDVPFSERARAWPRVASFSCVDVHEEAPGSGRLCARLAESWCADAGSRLRFASAVEGTAPIVLDGVVEPGAVMDRDVAPSCMVEAGPGSVLGDDLVTSRVFPLHDALDVVEGVLRVLSRMHGQPAPLVHGALCPRTTWLVQGGGVRLLHRGIAPLAEKVSRGHDGVMVQRPWLAPEQLFGLSPTPATDVYRAAQLLPAMVTGDAPFVRDTAMRTIEAIGRDELPRLELPPRVDAWWRACMSREPALRPADAALALKALREARA